MKHKLLLFGTLLSAIHTTSYGDQKTTKTVLKTEKPRLMGMRIAHDSTSSPNDVVSHKLGEVPRVYVMKGSDRTYEILTNRLRNAVESYRDTPVSYLEDPRSIPPNAELVFVSLASNQDNLGGIVQKLPKDSQLMVQFSAGVQPPEAIPGMQMDLSISDFYPVRHGQSPTIRIYRKQ